MYYRQQEKQPGVKSEPIITTHFCCLSGTSHLVLEALLVQSDLVRFQRYLFLYIYANIIECFHGLVILFKTDNIFEPEYVMLFNICKGKMAEFLEMQGSP